MPVTPIALRHANEMHQQFLDKKRPTMQVMQKMSTVLPRSQMLKSS